MVIGPRPSIGWLGYFVIGKSWIRMLVMIGILLVIAVFLLHRSKESIHLRFMRPSYYPPPILIVPMPDHGNLNAFDACSVEAASKTKAASVNVYVWTSNVSPSDRWTKLIANMEGVRLSFLDINKALASTPITGMFMNGGWAGKPAWAVWMATGGGLLWNTGGILMQTGVLMTKPLKISTKGENSGLLVAEKNRMQPIAIGNKHHHPLTESILESIKDYQSPGLITEMTSASDNNSPHLKEILTLETRLFCGAFPPREFMDTECAHFNVLNATSDVWDFDFTTKKPMNFADRPLLRYTGDNQDMINGGRNILRFFQKYKFGRFCPLVFNELLKMAEDL